METISKKPPENFVIVKAVPVQDVLNLQIRIYQVSVYSCESDLILIFQKCHPHILFEKPAKIARFQRHERSSLFDGDLLCIVLVDKLEKRQELFHIPDMFSRLIIVDPVAEVAVQSVNCLVQQTVE